MTDWKRRSIEMHRRAQKAEGELKRMKAAHEEVCLFAFKKSIDYRLYGWLLLNHFQKLYPKLTERGRLSE
jgi:hypothetical protein